jgi:branched-chain amino acid transport system substrate-binding protein
MFARNLSRLGILATALLASTAALAQVSDDVVKIGVLTDMNGPAATPTGQGSVTSAQMAIDDFGGKVLGKPISIIVGDHQLKPDIGGAIARRWYDVDQVDLIVDVPVSAVGLAVQNIANDKKKLFITHSTLAADFHGKFCTPYAMQWVIDTRSLAAGTAQAVVKRGGDSWFFITDDYAFGHALERDASAVVTTNGGKVLGSVRPPLATPDLSSFVLQAQASKAKIIGIAAGPPNNMNEIKTAAEFGVFKGHGRQDPRMVKTLFRQDEPDADDVAGRRLFLGHELSQRHQGSRYRRAAESGGEDARKADRGFLLPQRQTARGQSDGA